jgi:trimeric autotransporter adhesin
MHTRNLLVGVSALALATTAAQAQNVNTISSIGVGNVAECNNETFGRTNNVCTIGQNGNSNRAIADQNSDNNTATIEQTGNNNTGTITQNSSVAGIGRNTASIDQTGNRNYTSIFQNRTVGSVGVPAHNASVIQSGGAGVTGSLWNTATVSQTGRNHDATVVQVGRYNTASVNQTGTGDPGHLSDINQSSGALAGSGNNATVNQSGNLARHQSEIEQVTTSGYVNAASHTQSGAGNYASTYQAARENSSTINQSGSLGSGDVQQTGVSNSAGLTQGGSSNTATFNQSGNFNQGSQTQSGSGNSGSINQSGVVNTATLTQSNSSNTAVFTQSGSYNDATQTQSGNGASGTVTQSGNSNAATHTQTGFDGSATTNQMSSLNTAITTIGEIGTGTSSTTQRGGNSNYSDILQRGIGGTVTVDQNGAQNTSTISLGLATYSDVHNVLVTQAGNRLESVVTHTGSTSGNQVLVNLQNNHGTGAAGNRSVVTQSTSDNSARAYVWAGGTGGGERNTSEITQSTGSSNEADVFITGANAKNNHSVVNQTSSGGSNFADITMSGGAGGANPVAGPFLGLSGANSSTINQTGTGRGAVASATIGTLSTTPGDVSLGNALTVNQNTSVTYAARGAAGPNNSNAASEGRFGYTEFTSSGNFTGSRGQYAEAWITGRFGSVQVNQSDGDPALGAGRTYSNGQIGRPRAGVYQAGDGFSATVNQTGDNYADVTQGLGMQGVVSLTQTDAGDLVVPGAPIPQPDLCDEFGCVPQAPLPGVDTYERQYNQALISQYGTGNAIDATQNTRNGWLTVWQEAGSSGVRAVVGQGTGGTGNPLAPNSGGVLANPAPTGAATQNLTANIRQRGVNNAARVLQDGSNLFVTVEQAGTGSHSVMGSENSVFGRFEYGDVTRGASGGQAIGNIVTIAQQGSNNRISATQTETVGRSLVGSPASGNTAAQNLALGLPNAADEYRWGGGARSAEIALMQSGSGNHTTVRQEGLGQYARVEQRGTNNTASIHQQQPATNATAVIEQAGSGNSYYVVQNAAGQYIHVIQNGTNNNAQNAVIRGPAGTYASTTPPPGS